MKKYQNQIIMALACVALAACAPKEIVPEGPDSKVEDSEFTYTLTIGEATKAVLEDNHIAWQSGDVIGWFTDKAGSSEVNMATTPRSFKVSSTAALAAGSKSYAYAPYKAGDQSKTAAPLCIPASQDGAAVNDAMPLVSLPIEIAAGMPAATETPAGEAQFMNMGALIQYNVYSSNSAYASEKLSSVKFASTSAIAGSFTADLTAVAPDAVPAPSGLTEKAVTSTLASATAVGRSKSDAVKVYQVVAPGTWSGTITVETDAATYEYSISSVEFPRSKARPISVDLASTGATRTAKGGSGTDDVETLLTAHTWALKGVMEAGVSVTSSIGNKLTLNANHTMSFDCSANGGQTYDHTWVGGLIAPDAYGNVSDMGWSVSSNGGKNYINVTGFLLVFAQEDVAGTYEIKELTDSKFSTEIITYDEAWTFVFEAAGTTPEPPQPGTLTSPYWHSFADGDWGIGPAYDWGGWTDGYYFDQLTNPYTLDGAVWTISNAGYFEWVGTEGWRKGIQLGANSVQVSNFTLSSDSFPGTITNVTLGYNAPGNVSGITVSCKVGGSAFGSPVTHGDGDYEAVFTGSASGQIVITIDSPAKCPVYLYYLSIDFTPN